ncbi:hypothetical protein SAMN05216201_10991 [Pseudomonas linyingensis]|uniref:Uncharacterized protein n=1 Tax=Pseudomonas linyingensis TaxID=915471 RepID=A0A1H6ZB46_9PSED|nr:hypothetical protein [Pseudomonas linyingensis]SEJ46790.1 hypothetical protein SAMN05216201_10991 [Pseudomonas linyingensis]
MSYETLEAAVQSLVSTNASLVAAVTSTQQQANEAIDEAAASINVTSANVTAAQAHANNAAASAGTVTGVQTAVATSVATATSKAGEAAASAAAAASAVLGQTTSKLDLAAIDQTVFASTTLVDAVIYDTSKDSDGGAWRKRCQHASWYREAIYGKWLGSAASEAAARAISGATTNDYYYDTTNAKFYALNEGSGRTEVFRGNVREFPARALITLEDTRLVVWDLTQPGSPMWAVFISGNAIWFKAAVAVCAGQGRILTAHNDASASDYDGLREFDLLNNRWFWVWGSNFYYETRLVSGPTPAAINGRPTWLPSSWALANRAVNDVALTVLPDSPIDPVTELPVPTIAVATDGGVSVIKHDGTVGSFGSTKSRTVHLDSDGLLFYSATDSGAGGGEGNPTVNLWDVPNWSFVAGRSYATVPSHYLSGWGTTVKVAGRPAGKSAFAVSGAAAAYSRVIHLRENVAGPTKAMAAISAHSYASGWMPGDIRGAWINRADGVTETLADTELVTNGGFDTDTTGWTADNAILSVVGGALRVTAAAGGAFADATQQLSVVAGKSYRFSLGSGSNDANGRAYFTVGGSATIAVDAGKTYEFTATTTGATTARLRVAAPASASFPNAGNYADFDNVSVREIITDRSVKNIGLGVKGALSRAPVATGAGLGAISGFSTANYLERPYSSDLDFGTAAFAFLVPLKEAANSADEVVFERGYYTGGAYSGARIRLEVLAAGTLKATFSDGTNAITLTSSTVIDDSVWRTGLVMGFDGTNFRLVSAGGKDLATPVARGSVGSLNNSNAVLRVGLGVDGTLPLTNGALAMLRATAMWPSADQLKYIYETERKLFEDNAQCALAGTSSAVTALTYDEDTDLLHVGTSWGRSAFQGLVRVASEATSVGAVKALSASGGAVAQAGASAVDIYVPAYSLREEVERLDDAARALGSRPVFHEFDAITGQTAFILPIGVRVVGVYSAGVLKRNGSTKDYTLAFDGFRWTVNFAVAPGNGAWVSIMTVRA